MVDKLAESIVSDRLKRFIEKGGMKDLRNLHTFLGESIPVSGSLPIGTLPPRLRSSQEEMLTKLDAPVRDPEESGSDVVHTVP